MYSGHTRRLIARLSQVVIAFVVAMAVGCSDDAGPYSVVGLGGIGGGGSGGSDTGGADGIGTGGSAAGTTGNTGSSGAGGPGGSIAGSGSGGSIGGSGPGGSIGGSGPGGSIGGSGGGAGAGGSGAGTGAAGTIGTGGTGAITAQPWPGSAEVVAVDSTNQFMKNLSDLVYQPPVGNEGDVLWGLVNSPPTLFCLIWNGTTWTGMTDDNWTFGKALHYPSGGGSPDTEGLTRTDWSSTAIYVASERDNNGGVSRMSVLRYDVDDTGIALTATNEWNLTPDLPISDPNTGLEGIAWVPDDYLVAHKFFDEAANAVYDPSRYANHAGGLFLVGHEGNGMIYAYALDHSASAGTFQRVATVRSGNPYLMSLDFDRDEGNLWAYCDNTCANQAAVLRIGASGRFELTHLYNRPTSLANSNYEGITIAPESECDAMGMRSFFWSDDDNNGMHALYRGSIPCGPLP